MRPPNRAGEPGPGETEMKLESLEQLFVEQLQDLYSAEEQIIEALPKMAKKCSSSTLRKAFEQHLEETKKQSVRLEDIFDQLGEAPKGAECKGMKGIIAEGEELMNAKAEPEAVDAALIATAQRVEHYEIAAYGTVRTYADVLGQDDCSLLLQKTLEEEKQADKVLNSLASRINLEAKAA
jgi:ferritin-like metal-binding protein YciE